MESLLLPQTHLVATQAILPACSLDLVASLPVVLQRPSRSPLNSSACRGVFASLLIWALCLFDGVSVAFTVFINKGLWSLCETLLNHPGINQKLAEDHRRKERNSQICFSFSFSSLKNKENLIKQFSLNEVAVLISGNRDQKILKL